MSRLFLTAALLLLPARSRADTVFLKNGNELEGVVNSQTASHVEIDLGYGTVTLPMSDILKIQRSKKEGGSVSKEVRRRMYLSGRKVPKSAAKLDKMFQEVKRLREAAFDAKTQRGLEEDKTQSARSETSNLRDQYTALTLKLQSQDPKADPKSYNATVDELNKTSTQLNAARNRVEDGPGKLRESDAAMQDYMTAYSDLKTLLQMVTAPETEGWEADYYAAVRAEIAKMGADFSHVSAGSERQGNHIIVTALLNGKVTARLMVDTGASRILLYKGVADALKLAPEAQLGTVQSHVADGRIVEARAVRLDSVAVGESVVHGVDAAIVDSPAQGFDGLLGMSFLSNFSVKVDSANGKLILESLK